MNQDLPGSDIAHAMAARQRDISVSEFFLKNRHLLGFDSPAKALLTTVKEDVDNALDACEEAGILPEIWVEVDRIGERMFKLPCRTTGRESSSSNWHGFLESCFMGRSSTS